MTEQQTFIYETLPELLERLSPEATAKWGVMGPQHMVEHVSATFYLSLGKKEYPIHTPPEKIPRRREWLLSDKPFHRNVRIPGAEPAKPLPLRFENMDDAKALLLRTVEKFRAHYESNPDAVSNHPIIGPLNKSDWERFHWKHLVHHFRQFGVLEDEEVHG